MKWTITVLVNNYVRGGGFRAEHGYSLLLKGIAEKGENAQNRSILLDTGQSFEILSYNSLQAGVDIAAVDTIVLSHGHYDHTGGLRGLLQILKEETSLYAHPAAFEKKYSDKNGLHMISTPVSRDEVLTGPAKIRLHEETGPIRIAPGLQTTGRIPRIHKIEEEAHRSFTADRNGERIHDEVPDDQSLVLHTEKGGFYLICGCCHSGLINTLEHAVELAGGKKVLGILGGLHMIGAGEERLRHTLDHLRSYDPGFIAPLHCAGARETAMLYRDLGEKVRFLSVGDTIEL